MDLRFGWGTRRNFAGTHTMQHPKFPRNAWNQSLSVRSYHFPAAPCCPTYFSQNPGRTITPTANLHFRWQEQHTTFKGTIVCCTLSAVPGAVRALSAGVEHHDASAKDVFTATSSLYSEHNTWTKLLQASPLLIQVTPFYPAIDCDKHAAK